MKKCQHQLGFHASVNCGAQVARIDPKKQDLTIGVVRIGEREVGESDGCTLRNHIIDCDGQMPVLGIGAATKLLV